MKCKEIQSELFAYIEGELSAEEMKLWKAHILECEVCHQEYTKTKELLSTMEMVPPAQPKETHWDAFDKMLEEEKEKYDSSTSKTISLNWKAVLQVAASLLLFIGGYLFGEYKSTSKTQQLMATLELQSQELKSDMTLAMLDNRSASRRIQGVSYSEELPVLDTQVKEALIGRFQRDENVNVRIAAAEALSRFQEDQLVKDAFIQAIEIETNPEVQIAVIRYLVQVKDRRSAVPLQNLLNQPEVLGFVKQEAKRGLSQIL